MRQPTPPERSTRLARAALAGSAVGLGVVLAVGGSQLLSRWFAPFADPAVLAAYIRAAGPAAPLAFVLLQAAQVVAAPVPSPVVSLAGGYLFGPVVGSLLTVLGVVLGSTVAFWLARRFGRRGVERFVPPSTLDRFDAVAHRRGPTGLFLAFLVPGLPDDVLCFVGGLTDIPIRRLVLIAVLGRTPSLVALTVLGDGIASGNRTLVLVLGGTVGLLSVVGFLLRDRLLGTIPGGEATDTDGPGAPETVSGPATEPDR